MHRFIIATCLAIAVLSGSSAFWMKAKSALGQHLLNQAWDNASRTGEVHKAWPWADTWPVARLTVAKTNQSLVVLEGTSGEAMAFGPGRVAESSQTAFDGSFAIAGHRDSHMSFLQDVQIGDVFILESLDKAKTEYTVVEQHILNAETQPLSIPQNLHALVLITCYPFNALQTGGPLRYVVIAQPLTEMNNHTRHPVVIQADGDFELERPEKIAITQKWI